MPGGVGALTSLHSEWGVGILARSAEETIQAALPATGMGLAVALAWVALYRIGLLLRRFVRAEAEPEVSTELDVSLSMEDVLPGAGMAGRWLDPGSWFSNSRL